MFANLVSETSTSNGLGDLTLDGAVTGRRTFSAAFGTGSGNPFRYVVDDGAGNWEIGRTFLSASATLVRGGSQTVLDSSNGGSPVSFPTGEKAVYCDVTADDVQAEPTEAHGTVSSGTLTLDAQIGWHEWTAGGDHTIAFSDWPKGARSVQALITGAVEYTLTWPGALKWDGGVPSWSPSAGGFPDISTATFDSLSFSFSAQDTAPRGIAFKPDGTKMYMTGTASNTVFQYSLSTAWEVSTASYDSISIDMSAQTAAPSDVFFKPDGTKMYTADRTDSKISQYTLSTAWDLSTASFDSVTFNVSSEEDTPFAVAFKDDGTKMYVAGQNSGKVSQYTLITPWDISTANYDSVFFDHTGQEGSATGITFMDNGNKMYLVGFSSDMVHQYTLSTAWDLSTVSFDSVSFNVSGEEDVPTDIAFKDDGTKMYVVGNNSDSVHQYTLSTSGSAPRTDIAEFISPDEGATIYGRRIWAEA